MTEPVTFSFDESTHTYRDRDGKRIISVTQVLASVGFVNYDFVKESVLEYKSSLGTCVHTACQFLDENDDLDWDTLAPEAVPYVVAYEKFKEDLQFTPTLIEHRGVVSLAGTLIGFQVDRVGMCGQFPCIVDLKCVTQESEAVKFQVALYEECLKVQGHKPEGQPWWKRFALQLRPDSTYRVWGPYESPRDIQIAKCAVAVASEKLLLGIGDK